ncbi:hypothetical protein RJ55_02982 [Drechmeria coniospora]|nr:hypothetical protein RJ55_02982 [Drechmeria coniospora]
MAVTSGTSSRVDASQWQHRPMQRPARAPWNVEIPSSDVANLLRGFVPIEMEDRWFCYADAADADDGTMLVHLCRSWTGAEMVVLAVRTTLDATGAVDESAAARVTEIRWEEAGEEGDRGEASAKETAEMVCRVVLNCQLAAGDGGT